MHLEYEWLCGEDSTGHRAYVKERNIDEKKVKKAKEQVMRLTSPK